MEHIRHYENKQQHDAVYFDDENKVVSGDPNEYYDEPWLALIDSGETVTYNRRLVATATLLDGSEKNFYASAYDLRLVDWSIDSATTQSPTQEDFIDKAQEMLYDICGLNFPDNLFEFEDCEEEGSDCPCFYLTDESVKAIDNYVSGNYQGDDAQDVSEQVILALHNLQSSYAMYCQGLQYPCYSQYTISALTVHEGVKIIPGYLCTVLVESEDGGGDDGGNDKPIVIKGGAKAAGEEIRTTSRIFAIPYPSIVTLPSTTKVVHAPAFNCEYASTYFGDQPSNPIQLPIDNGGGELVDEKKGGDSKALGKNGYNVTLNATKPPKLVCYTPGDDYIGGGSDLGGGSAARGIKDEITICPFDCQETTVNVPDMPTYDTNTSWGDLACNICDEENGCRFNNGGGGGWEDPPHIEM